MNISLDGGNAFMYTHRIVGSLEQSEYDVVEIKLPLPMSKLLLVGRIERSYTKKLNIYLTLW